MLKSTALWLKFSFRFAACGPTMDWRRVCAEKHCPPSKAVPRSIRSPSPLPSPSPSPSPSRTRKKSLGCCEFWVAPFVFEVSGGPTTLSCKGMLTFACDFLLLLRAEPTPHAGVLETGSCRGCEYAPMSSDSSHCNYQH